MTGRSWVRVSLWALLLPLAGCGATISAGSVARERLTSIQAVRVLPLNAVEANAGEIVRDAIQAALLQEGIRVLGPADEAQIEGIATVVATLTKDLYSYSLSARVVQGGTQEPLAVVTLSQGFSMFYEPPLPQLGRSLGLALAALMRGRTRSAEGLLLVAERERPSR